MLTAKKKVLYMQSLNLRRQKRNTGKPISALSSWWEGGNSLVSSQLATFANCTDLRNANLQDSLPAYCLASLTGVRGYIKQQTCLAREGEPLSALHLAKTCMSASRSFFKAS